MVGKYIGLTDSYLSVVKVNLESQFSTLVFFNWISIAFGLLCSSYFPSSLQALLHACIACSLKPHIEWIAASDLEDESEKSVYIINDFHLLESFWSRVFIPTITVFLLSISFSFADSGGTCCCLEHLEGKNFNLRILWFDLFHNLSTCLLKRRHLLPTISSLFFVVVCRAQNAFWFLVALEIAAWAEWY